MPDRPTHWYAGSQAASYGYAAVLLVAVCAYARTPDRRTLSWPLLLAVGIAQFAWAFVAWHKLGSPSTPMMGRFFWYNQFAAFELAPAVIGLGLAISGAVPLRLLAGVAAVLGSVGVVLSTSRASMALLVIGWLPAAVVALVGAPTARARARVAVRWLLLAAATAGVLFAVTGPPFFDQRASVLGATASRGVGQPVTQNGVYRLDFWRQSLHLIREHVLTGTGFGSFGRQTRLLDPNAPHANFVHNGYPPGDQRRRSAAGLCRFCWPVRLSGSCSCGGSPGLPAVRSTGPRRWAPSPSCCSRCTAESTSTGAMRARSPR